MKDDRKIRAKLYYLKNREHILERQRLYYKTYYLRNRDRLLNSRNYTNKYKKKIQKKCIPPQKEKIIYPKLVDKIIIRFE